MTNGESWEIQLLRYYVEHTAEWNRAVRYFKSLIEVILSNERIDVVEIRSRVKTFESCVEKVSRRGYLVGVPVDRQLDQLQIKITDFLGVRVVCFFSDDVQRVADAIRKSFRVKSETNKIEELEETESAFGYRAHHLDAYLSDRRPDTAEFVRYGKLPFEVQVRTIVQESWTVLQNKLIYKRPTSRTTRRKIAMLAAFFESIDHDFIELREQVRKDIQEPENVDLANPEGKGDESRLLNEISRLFPDETLPAVLWQRLMFDLDQLQPDWQASLIASEVEKQSSACIEFFRAYPEYSRKLGTKIRILLYASNPVLFRAMLAIQVRQVFDAWRRVEHLER